MLTKAVPNEPFELDEQYVQNVRIPTVEETPKNRFASITEKTANRFASIKPTPYTVPRELADKFVASPEPIYEWQPQEQAEIAKSIMESIGGNDLIAKQQNALYMASLFNIPFESAILLHDELGEYLTGKKDHPAIAVLEDIKKYQIKRKNLRQTLADAYHQAGVNMAQSVAGSVKFLGESGFAKVLSVAGASQAGTYGMMKDENGEVYDIGKDWSKWGDQILQGVDEYRKQNPDQTVQIIDKQGFFNTAAQYIDRPENILQISLESVPALVSAAVGHYTGLNAAKAIGWGPKVLPYIGRVVGFASQTFGSTYAEARQQGTPPELAFPQAFLTAAGEGMLEDITLPGKLKLFHGTGKLAQKGIAGTAAQLLMGYPDGAVEEGTQRLNANFWNMVFSDHNQNLIDGVLEEAVAGGFAEVEMRAGFGGAGKVYKMTFKEAFENGRAMQEFVSTARLDPVARQEITDEIAKATIEKATGVQVENISELGLTSEEILSLEPEEAQAVVETLQTATETPPTSTPDGQTQAQPTFNPPATVQGGGKHKGFVDLTTLQEASEEVKGDVRRIADVFSHVSKNLLEKISFALENIHPGLSSAVRWHAFDKMKNTYNSLVQAKPFVKSMKRLRRSNRKAYDRLGYLLKKNDYNAMMELAGKYNLDATITDVLELLKDIYTRAEYAGVRIEFRNDYFPRKVKDMKKFLEIVYAIPGLDRSIIEDALKKKADKQGRKVEDLTDREISDTINTLFRGFKTGGVVMAAPGGSKERLVSEFTEAVDEAYSSAEDGLVIYIEEMESAIAEYEFFGRMSTDLRRLRSRESYYRSRLSALTKLLANAKTEAEKGKLSDQYKDLTDAVTKLEGKLFDAQKTLDDIMQSQSEFNEMDRRPSIGEITAELVRKDEIKPGQEREVQQILKAYFNPGVQNVLIRSAMEVGYLAALGNSVLHNITQLGEVANALLEDPILAFPAAAKVLLREEIVKHEDIPHKLFSEEINLGGGFNRMVNRILRITLGADDFGKAVHRNTAAMKAFRKAANEDSAFIEELKLYFGDQWQTALNDMKTGQVTENLLFYVFNRVSDRQPITAAEMPVYYHTSPNIARPFFYMLKSFQLNRMNSIYQNARRDIRNGHYAKGLMGAAIATAVYLAFDTSMKLLKDAIRGRKIDDDEVEDAVIDNSLRMLFMSKYMIESFDYRSPSEVIMNSIKHPFMSVIDDAVRAYKNEDTEPLEKYIPIVGREIYESGK